MTFTFPSETRKSASKKGLITYKGGTPCQCCGDFRRFRLESNYLCWTCYMGEDYLSKPKVSCATINKSLGYLEFREKKHARVLVAAGSTRRQGKIGSRIGP